MTVAASCKTCEHSTHAEQCTEPVNGNYAFRCQCVDTGALSDTSRNAREAAAPKRAVWPESTA